MKKIFFLILLGPLLLSQNFQTKDSLKILAQSNFKSMEIFKNENGKLLPTESYSYNQDKREFIIKNISDKNKDWIKTIVTLDNEYNIKEEEKIIEGMIISDKENILVKKQVSLKNKYVYSNNTVSIKKFNDKGSLMGKKFMLFDKENRIIESISLFNIPEDIVITEIEKYNWIDTSSYNYEKITFNAPKSKVTGVYKLNKYGDRKSFKGSFIVNNKAELIDYHFNEKIKKNDSRGNLIQVYEIENGSKILIEERKIIY
ncbi:hypothetical protein [Chryseobacterium balustinum]|uniref:Uncharacterized protein n=1 Tax=Chryseobacterium balustinum TaxID=246 RepID=A0AAX2IP90_9FLAO|nr:hypothetical protein [Chryseobacterium balustinum]AZB28704.1 hypothetical protein EB354_05200 [Chryseobacterium balustinum]SKC07163.1 hypothetical protein SAMN05421800_12645 [Chryseobacterium balustinum]SQA91841.1 Uncharacterised protein [Chryseobacterium balustinum]